MTDSSESEPVLRTAFKVGAESDQAIALMVALLDQQDAALPIRRLRGWGLDRALVGSGQIVLDVGSGTGAMVRAFAALVGPDGRAVGVEPNSRLRAIAVERADGLAGADFVDGLADRLPFDDDSVDLIWCERVLQHLADPQAALAEFHRALRPGGRAIVLDSDHGTRVTSDLEPDVERRVMQGFLATSPNPHAARNLPRQAIAAGFAVDPDIGSAALTLPGTPPGGQSVLVVALRHATQSGLISAAEESAALVDHARAVAGGWWMSAVTLFGFVLVKPV